MIFMQMYSPFAKGVLRGLKKVLRHLFTAIFSLELLLRMLGNGLHGFCCSEEARWNLLDVFIVLSSWWETAIESIYSASQQDLDVVGFSGLRALRILRITRLVRLARVARILRFVMALRTLTQSILYTLRLN